jgi:ribonuclease HI
VDPSPAWRGVEFGLELLKEGIIKRIGDGRSTQFSRDNWLPRDSGLKIAGLKKNSQLRWVNQLISPGSNSWNTSLLHELFFDFDVQTILKINLPVEKVDDYVAWHFKRNGIFTVKSAYRLALNLKQKQRGNESSSNHPSGERGIWNAIWKSNVPPKVRIFGWRVAMDALPTKKNKWRRTLELNNVCSICGNGVEDAHHANVACTKSKALRHALRQVWDLPDETEFRVTGRDWLQHLLANSDCDARAKTLLMLWRAWHLRNDIIHQEGKASVTSSVFYLQSLHRDLSTPANSYEDYKGKRAMVPCEASKHAITAALPLWSAPPPGWLKLNTDGSLVPNSTTGGAGVVVRDCTGSVLLAACSPLENCIDAEEAEARAALWGLKLISRQAPAGVLLEMDCLHSVAALQSKDQDRSRLWNVYGEAKNLLQNLKVFEVKHSKRETNRVADALAKLALCAGERIMRADIPLSIRELVMSDANTCITAI